MRHLHRRVLAGMTLLCMAVGTFSERAAAQPQGTTFYLRPHCESAQDAAASSSDNLERLFEAAPADRCREFLVKDPTTLKSDALRTDDVLDMDLMLNLKEPTPVYRIRAWLSYDPDVLEGMDVEVDDAFPSTTPGEVDFDPLDGLIMLEATREDDSDTPLEGSVRFARIRMRVSDAVPPGTPISFHDVQPEGHTVVTTKAGKSEDFLTLEEPGSLFVRFVEGNAEEENQSSSRKTVSSATEQSSAAQLSSAPPPASVAVSSASSQFSLPPLPSGFTNLQVQDVRVTTQDQSLYIAWEPLQHPGTAAYNIYYGTTSGRYIQRKTVPAAQQNLAVEGLPPGSRYYVAVRAVNDTGEESVFSKEAAVIIGDPASSTSPLLAALGGGTTAPNAPKPGSVSATGLPSFVVLSLLALAAGALLTAAKSRTALRN